MFRIKTLSGQFVRVLPDNTWRIVNTAGEATTFADPRDACEFIVKNKLPAYIFA